MAYFVARKAVQLPLNSKAPTASTKRVGMMPHAFDKLEDQAQAFLRLILAFVGGKPGAIFAMLQASPVGRFLRSGPPTKTMMRRSA